MAQLRLYFHQETTLNLSPNAPAGCHTLSQALPDQVENTAGGGHTSSAAATAYLVEPGTTGTVTAAGPPTTTPVSAAQQLGWISDIPISGNFSNAVWLFNWREHDSGGVTGGPVINLFASGTRDWANARFLAQLDYSATNWWTGAAVGTPVVNSQSVTPAGFTLNNEYLIVQLWCKESSGGAAQTHVIHTEFSGGNDTALNASQRSSLLTSNFTTYVRNCGANSLLGCGT